ncbi:uncharacterized protein LOC141629097 [Silene latifolia]|uniref:uncharacterized protein LOC141629097 n=1 Tax=Silene latifolia TaxID=37657 RepID=UPI003D7701D2
MSIDCSDPVKFPPLSSNSNNKQSVEATLVSDPSTSAVIGGPGSGDGNKSANINQVVGIAPYNLDGIDQGESSDWVVQNRRKGKKTLQSIPEEVGELLQFSDEDVKEELEYWRNSVYGFILGANPPVEGVEGFLRRLWASYPIDKISFCANGVFLVRFKNATAKDQILQQGHFLFDNKPLIIRPWSEDAALEKEEIKEVPVWVKIHNLPLKFWGKCLPRIAGLMGKFVRCDGATTEKTRLSFARVMIDVPFGKPIPSNVKFMDSDGSILKKKRDTQKVPAQKGGQKQWRPKQAVVPVTSTSVGSPTISAPSVTECTPYEKPNNFDVTWATNGKYHMANTPARKIIRHSRQEILAANFGSNHLKKIGLFGLLETKVKPLSLNAVRNNLCSSWCLTTYTQYHKGGRIWVLWNPSLFRVYILNYNAQFIHLEATDLAAGTASYVTFVYAFNDTQERKSLWSNLCEIKKTIQGPWVICGDFNTVLQPSERLGGSSTMEEMDDFKACVDECEVMDCPASGSLYTWCNKHEQATRVYSRLDRVLVNQEWLQNNGQAFAHFFCESTFDYTPCVVQRKTDLCKRNRSFKYFNMWSKSVDFIPCVQLNWGKKWPGTKMFNLVKKLKHLKRPLKELNRVDFDDIENTTARARMYLESIQIKLRSEPQNAELIHLEWKSLAKRC